MSLTLVWPEIELPDTCYRLSPWVMPSSVKRPEFTHLCKAAEELESALYEAAGDYLITEEFPKGFSEAERQQRSDAEGQARRQLSEHFSEQVRAGRYRDIPERVLFEHSEPDAERLNQ